jgi:2-aminophenol/2-amino-5-chlorophenol 1,6-dioxygenase alpha subunit
VDDEFHELGSIPYEFSFHKGFAKALCESSIAKGLSMKSVDYEGFPVDTGSVVALKLLNPQNEFKSSIVSSNIYADRAETVVLGKACKEALQSEKLSAVAIVVSTLSNRLHQKIIKPSEDKIHSLKDQEWNLKAIEFLRAGRLEDLSQLSRQIHKEARVKKVNNFKPLWWLSSLMGSHNRYTGNVFSYEPVYGTGCVVASLTPATSAARDLEFDEDSPEFFQGERNVLESSEAHQPQSRTTDEEEL